jgi:predicted alpha/beta-hydrolase family hydrolase
MNSPFMANFADGLANRGHTLGGLQVVRFEFPYMMTAHQQGKSRPPDREPVLLERWRNIIDTVQAGGCPRERLVIGGKSLGGRMASLIADEQRVAALVCLGYPFHPPGKPTNLRIAHLQTLKTPTLICQGTRDPFGNKAEVPNYELSSSIRLHWLEDGEHSFKPRKASGFTEMDHWQAAMEAIMRFIQDYCRSF